MTSNQERKPIDVVCALIENGDGRILAACRGEKQSHSGFWEFPGGKIDPGETAEQALARELQEELSISVKITTQLTPVVFHYPAKSIRLIPFICRILEGKPFPHEHSEIRWVDAEETGSLHWSSADIPVLDEYRSLYNPNTDHFSSQPD